MTCCICSCQFSSIFQGCMPTEKGVWEISCSGKRLLNCQTSSCFSIEWVCMFMNGYILNCFFCILVAERSRSVFQETNKLNVASTPLSHPIFTAYIQSSSNACRFYANLLALSQTIPKRLSYQKMPQHPYEPLFPLAL